MKGKMEKEDKKLNKGRRQKCVCIFVLFILCQ